MIKVLMIILPYKGVTSIETTQYACEKYKIDNRAGAFSEIIKVSCIPLEGK